MNASFALRGTLTRLADQIAESEKISATFRKTGNKICHFRKKLKFDLPALGKRQIKNGIFEFDLPLWLFFAKNICHTRPGARKAASPPRCTSLIFMVYSVAQMQIRKGDVPW
ncbi:MAG: hypothetical protein PUC71_00530 [Oscillospiraceae bacterium]|nr:hypothetical protein [Oscillospiraceae bacterium]